MPLVMEEILILWKNGKAISPILVWGKGAVLEIKQLKMDGGFVSAVLKYVKRGSFTACQFGTEFLSKNGNLKYLYRYQSKPGGNTVVAPWICPEEDESDSYGKFPSEQNNELRDYQMTYEETSKYEKQQPWTLTTGPCTLLEH